MFLGSLKVSRGFLPPPSTLVGHTCPAGALCVALEARCPTLPCVCSRCAGVLQGLRVGLTLAVAIALHNIPEGVAVALPIYYGTRSRAKAFWLAAFSGLAEPLAVVAVGGRPLCPACSSVHPLFFNDLPARQLLIDYRGVSLGPFQSSSSVSDLTALALTLACAALLTRASVRAACSGAVPVGVVGGDGGGPAGGGGRHHGLPGAARDAAPRLCVRRPQARRRRRLRRHGRHEPQVWPRPRHLSPHVLSLSSSR